MERTEVKGLKVTIYIRSENSLFGGVNRVEGKLYSYGTRKFAQYDSAPFIEYVEKGCRTRLSFTGTSHPYILVLKGWNKWPDAPDMMTEARSEGGFTVRTTKYASHDDRYVTDFEKELGPISPDDVVVDFRGHNSSERKYT